MLKDINQKLNLIIAEQGQIKMMLKTSESKILSAVSSLEGTQKRVEGLEKRILEAEITKPSAILPMPGGAPKPLSHMSFSLDEGGTISF